MYIMEETLEAVSLERPLCIACFCCGLATFQHNVKKENSSIVEFFLPGDIN